MASNIGTLGTFQTTNMKPVSGEVIDSLWGQNIGDSLGALWETERLVACHSEIMYDDHGGVYPMAGTWFYKKSRIGANLLVGTIYGTGNLQTGGDYSGTLYCNGDVMCIGAVTNPANRITAVFSFDISGTAYDTMNEIAFSMSADNSVANKPRFCFNVWERP